LSLTGVGVDNRIFFFSKGTFLPTRVRDNGDTPLNTLIEFNFFSKAVAQDPKMW
jgi:hypothetical protein